MKRYLIIGGSGFIGSNFVEKLLDSGSYVVALDNLSSGNKEFLKKFLKNPNFHFIEDEIANWQKYKQLFSRIDVLIHLASNADIAAAINDPTIDFFNGTLLTQQVAELARTCKIPKLLYASGSGVYGDHGNIKLNETDSLLRPISPYGASKLGGEAILASYSYLFKIKIYCFRFANVVGKNQTHGVGLDFIKNLHADSSKLKILGDGNQSKSYIHIDDLMDAVLLVSEFSTEQFDVYNVSNDDQVSVREIASLSLKTMNLDEQSVRFEFGSMDRGWAGDVPIVILDSGKLKKLGWGYRWNSKQSMELALESIWHELNSH